MTRKSLIAPTLFTIFGVALLLALGTWQLHRLQWKRGLIAERAVAVGGVAVPLPTDVAAAHKLAFHHIAATGRFLPRPALRLYAMELHSHGAPGYQLISPLRLADGGLVMVDRGFVPADDRTLPPPPAGLITVTGLLRFAEPPGFFTPANNLATNNWYFVDLPAMAKAAGVGAVLPFYIDADPTPPGQLPVGGQTIIGLTNNHLEYAVTWYGLALTLLVFYILLVLRHRRPGGP